MNIRVAAAVLKQALSLMQSMPTKTKMPEFPNLDEYKVSVAKYFSPMEAPPKRAPSLIQKVPEKERVVPTGIGCVQCSRDHISTVTAVLNEAMRFAREGGLSHPEVQRRIELAIDELNVMERIDAAPDALVKLPPEEKAIMDEFLPKARQIRQRLGQVKSVDELERIAADSHAVRMELRVKKSGLSEQVISRIKDLAREVNEGKITKEEAVSKLKDMQEDKSISEVQDPSPILSGTSELQQLLDGATKYDLIDIAYELEKETGVDRIYLVDYMDTKEAMVKNYLRWIAEEPEYINLLEDKLRATFQREEAKRISLNIMKNLPEAVSA